jgi:hypothetical protein
MKEGNEVKLSRQDLDRKLLYDIIALVKDHSKDSKNKILKSIRFKIEDSVSYVRMGINGVTMMWHFKKESKRKQGSPTPSKVV